MAPFGNGGQEAPQILTLAECRSAYTTCMAPFGNDGQEAPQILTLAECASAHATFMAPFDQGGEEAPQILTLVECLSAHATCKAPFGGEEAPHNTNAGGMPLNVSYVHGAAQQRRGGAEVPVGL
ncbi:unnamed protein product, partial [Nesidiocoris tenuis]